MQIWGCKVYQGVPHVKMRGAAWKPPTYRWVQRSELEHSLNMVLCSSDMGYLKVEHLKIPLLVLVHRHLSYSNGHEL